MTKAEKTTRDYLRDAVKGYADTLASLVSGIGYTDIIDVDEDDEDEKALLESDSYYRLQKYFEDVLDVEFRVDLRGDYRGARIALALGGPGVYLDTRASRIDGYWGFGSDHAEYFLDSATNNAVDDYFAELWEITRRY